MSKLEHNNAKVNESVGISGPGIKEKTKLKDSTKFLILAVLIVILLVLIPIGYALFSNTKQENVSTHIGKIKVELVEDWPEPGQTVTVDDETGTPQEETYDEFGINKKTKTIHGHSTEELSSYVRVRLIPVIEYYVSDGEDGQWITAPVSQDKFVVNVEGDSWVRDGYYWYYKKILPGFSDTDNMNISWQVAEIPTEIASYPIRTNVRVLLEYAQTTNDMWKDLFQIDRLPAGIQTPEGGVTE